MLSSTRTELGEVQVFAITRFLKLWFVSHEVVCVLTPSHVHSEVPHQTKKRFPQSLCCLLFLAMAEVLPVTYGLGLDPGGFPSKLITPKSSLSSS